MPLTGSAPPGRANDRKDPHSAWPTRARGTIMSEEAKAARQALQESMDLRDQGHTED